MKSQRTKAGGTGIYGRGFLGITREAQLGITATHLNEFILNMGKDLRKWCHETYHQFLLVNGIEDEPSVGYRENVNKMHFNSHFDFNQKQPNDSTVILDFSMILLVMKSMIQQSKIPSIFCCSNSLPRCIKTPPISCLHIYAIYHLLQSS